MINIFFVSFLVALTGALSPGPVLTFTIYRSLKGERGYLAGLFITLGHATLEFGLIVALLLGASFFLQNIIVYTIIGIVGGILLIFFGAVVIKDIYNRPIDINLAEIKEEDIKGFTGNSFLGGIIVSLSNPFWTLWWAGIGLGLMVSLEISFQEPIGLLLFFLGHEMGDLIWFWPVSIFVYLGGKALNPKIYRGVLLFCGAFMIFFGSYLALKIVFFPEFNLFYIF
ncbi:MAG: LysE type translocator [Promethearchaeota archaeon]|nr:MAG: LysE type translocator [Candidatus Lokiarchaeota archaeon]